MIDASNRLWFRPLLRVRHETCVWKENGSPSRFHHRPAQVRSRYSAGWVARVLCPPPPHPQVREGVMGSAEQPEPDQGAADDGRRPSLPPPPPHFTLALPVLMHGCVMPSTSSHSVGVEHQTLGRGGQGLLNGKLSCAVRCGRGDPVERSPTPWGSDRPSRRGNPDGERWWRPEGGCWSGAPGRGAATGTRAA